MDKKIQHERHFAGATHNEQDRANELSPAGVRRYITPRWDLLARLPSHVTPLVIAPWLSPRTRAALDRAGTAIST